MRTRLMSSTPPAVGSVHAASARKPLTEVTPRHRAGSRPRYDRFTVAIWLLALGFVVAFWVGVVMLILALVG